MKKRNLDRYYTWIGKITADYGLLEFFVNCFACRLAGNEKFFNTILLAGLSFTTLRAKLEALFDIAFSSKRRRRELRNILNRIDKVRIERNRIVHSVWIYEAETLTMLRTRLVDRSELMEDKEFNLRDLQKFHRELVSVINEFLAFESRLPNPLITPTDRLTQTLIDAMRDGFSGG